MGDRRISLGAFIVASVTAAPLAAYGKCILAKMADMPVTMADQRPIVAGSINGAPVSFLVDSGAFFSILSPADAAEFKLPTFPVSQLKVIGVGGQAADVVGARVKTFTVAGVPKVFKDVDFLIGGTSIGAGSIGLLGQNILRIADVEYDLANGVIRLIHEDGCKKADLAYWVKSNDEVYYSIDIQPTSPLYPHTTAVAYVNGVKIKVMFDTGAGSSMLSLRAAERAGVKPDSPGVREAGSSFGLGRATMRSWIAPFASFKIGDEEIRNTHLRISDAVTDEADMLIGPDFFLSHRIYVANEQHKLYFTYNGGPVFSLTTVASHASAATAAAGGTTATPAAPTTAPADQPSAATSPDAPATAQDFSRRGNGFAARHDYVRAIADLTRACELAPGEPNYFYERGMAHAENGEMGPAMSDFDQALNLKPDHIPALLNRAELRLRQNNAGGATLDLDAADHASAKESNDRFRMASEYQRADQLESALAQIDLWIAAHRADARMAQALNERCRFKALADQDLKNALDDCNQAIRRTDKKDASASAYLESRGLVRLRLGDYVRSIADYDAVIAVHPKHAWAFYGRGIDQLRLGRTVEGEADIAAAIASAPGVAEQFRKHGIVP